MMAELNEAEEFELKLRRVKDWLSQGSHEPAGSRQDNEEEVKEHEEETNARKDHYYDKLQRDLIQKKKFLREAKKALFQLQAPETVEEELQGVLYTNERLPFKEERGDSIGLVLALGKVESQVVECRQLLEKLNKDSKLLDERLAIEKGWNDELNLLVNELSKRQEKRSRESNDRTEDGVRAQSMDETALRAKISEEKQRYRQLRNSLKSLQQT